MVGRRLVGLALALTDREMPVFGSVYPGNRHDINLFSELFQGVCERVEAVGSDLEDVTLIFDRGFDDEDNFDLSRSSDAHVVAGAKRNRKPVKGKIDDAELDEFQLSHETDHGKCYVRDSGRIEIGENEWRIVLSYHDTTREKIREDMRETREKTEVLLNSLRDKIESGGRGRPLTAGGIEGRLRDVLRRRYGCLDWDFDESERELEWGWSEEWDRKYETAGIHAVVTDHGDWSPSKVVRTYFNRKDLEDMFHLTKKALVVPVEPPYVKEDHLVRAHLFLVFVGLLCYQHIRRELPDEMSEKDVKKAFDKLDVIVAMEDDSLQFKLGNVDRDTLPLLTSLELEKFLPE